MFEYQNRRMDVEAAVCCDGVLISSGSQLISQARKENWEVGIVIRVVECRVALLNVGSGVVVFGGSLRPTSFLIVSGQIRYRKIIRLRRPKSPSGAMLKRPDNERLSIAPDGNLSLWIFVFGIYCVQIFSCFGRFCWCIGLWMVVRVVGLVVLLSVLYFRYLIW